jgi:hypothetical protein
MSAFLYIKNATNRNTVAAFVVLLRKLALDWLSGITVGIRN